MLNKKNVITWDSLYEGIILEDMRSGNYVIIHSFSSTHAIVGIGYGVMISLQICEILTWFSCADNDDRAILFVTTSPGRKVGDFGQWDHEETNKLVRQAAVAPMGINGDAHWPL